MDLVQSLTVRGALTSDWTVPFLSVKRADFLPDILWSPGKDRRYRPVHRKDEPERWQELADSDEAVVTQVDHGIPSEPGLLGKVATSSSSMPYMVALMLKHLNVFNGEKVLEIGTGTGWNAALLAHRLGGEHITTVEIDPDLAIRAQGALIDAGYAKVTALVRDGMNGCSSYAPYHRVISTAACHTVPFDWVRQTRPGGRIVTPWGREWSNWGLLALDVHDDETATGSVVDTASFMRLRGQEIPFCPIEPTDEQEETAYLRSTSISPSQIMRSPAVLMAMTAQIENCQARYRAAADDPDGENMLFLADRLSGSWARVHHVPEGDGRCLVYQFGARLLFDEVESAFLWWEEQGHPKAQDWKVIVTNEGQRIELT